ncbi:hypothetical protein ACJMK2_028615 [Sinanodonta woodiana]|uniref:Uncharacterized protein n=1 Tax=Sinanodonta woodiana TaxID=1069815 RepID=A0ABD3XBK4_SINWO
MKSFTVAFMMGISFTFGLLLGLVIHLPASTLPAAFIPDAFGGIRFQRSLQTFGKAWIEPETTANDNQANSEIEDKAYLRLPGAIAKNPVQAHYSPLSSSLNNDNHKAHESIKHKSGHSETVIHLSGDQPESLVYVASVENKLIFNDTVITSKYKKYSYTGDQGDGDLSKSTNDTDKSALEVVLHQQKDENSKTNQQALDNQNQTIQKFESDNVLVDSIIWAPSVDNACHYGFFMKDHDIWKKKVTKEKILKIEEGCGRMQNRLLTFHDASKACARYRLNVDQIQGEIYSYYLSKLLGMNNVPPSTLQLVNFRDNQWSMVQHQIATSQWAEDKPFVLARWIDGLSPAYIPHEFREQGNKGLQPDHDYLRQKSKSELCELLQWSDLIIFDYLTANLDRVVNNMFNKQWNDQMMNRPAHNLEKSSDGHLVFLDNESGLFHGYRLLDKYSPFHQVLLDSLCVFRKSTIDNIGRLVKSESIGDELQKLFETNEPLFRHIPKIPKSNVKVLQQRLLDVYKRMQFCNSLYSK